MEEEQVQVVCLSGMFLSSAAMTCVEPCNETTDAECMDCAAGLLESGYMAGCELLTST